MKKKPDLKLQASGLGNDHWYGPRGNALHHLIADLVAAAQFCHPQLRSLVVVLPKSHHATLADSHCSSELTEERPVGFLGDPKTMKGWLVPVF